MSRLLLGLAQQIASNGDNAEIDATSIAQAILLNSDSALTLGNVLGVYLLYWPAVGSVTKFSTVVKILFNEVTSTIQEEDLNLHLNLNLNLQDSLDYLEANILDDRIVKVSTDDLISDTHQSCLKLGFNTNSPTKPTLVKAYIYSKNHSTITGNKFLPLLDIVVQDDHKDPDFDQWLRCVFEPYAKAQSSGLVSLSFAEFSRLHFEDQFSVLVSGLTDSNSSLWLQLVLLPFLDSNISPLIHWLFTLNSLESHYKLWGRCLVTIVESGAPVEEFVEKYILAVYYYGINSTLSKRDTMRVYDSVRDTLTITNAVLQPGNSNEVVSVKTAEKLDPLFEEFCRDHKISIEGYQFDLTLLLIPNTESSLNLIQTLDVCDKLSATSNITLPNYLLLKYTPNNYADKHRQALGITNEVNETTYPVVLQSIYTFKTNFIDPEETKEFNELLLHRLLRANLFNAVEELFQEGSFLSNNQFFEGVLAKFWDSFDAAESVNDKIDKNLATAVQCIPLLELSTNGALSKKNHGELIQIKHLLKAVNYLKNFKLSWSAPRKLIDKFTPIELVGHILEQNGKLYLAFEKLFKISTELSLYFQNPDESSTFAQLLLICIELALIDGNFMFAYNHLIQLFNHLDGIELGDTWLTFYQVGSYSGAWSLDSQGPKEKIDILLKQREILSLLLQYGVEESKSVLALLARINLQLKELYKEISPSQPKINDHSISSLASNLVHEATHTTHHASERLGNLFVLGLGWAIGANK